MSENVTDLSFCRVRAPQIIRRAPRVHAGAEGAPCTRCAAAAVDLLRVRGPSGVSLFPSAPEAQQPLHC